MAEIYHSLENCRFRCDQNALLASAERELLVAQVRILLKGEITGGLVTRSFLNRCAGQEVHLLPRVRAKLEDEN
jgi:hypothetical protein